ncbi:hypothetical protein CVT25_010664 [Psilocybe cyanescens]|uniref:Uncharacterized protein n=1 Tax=Psilocybe cyanescens TaxID=93625 RepID=A0A409WK28_PSICY|nr:hypothetical protein CVT25_010664 [Psilocybe cyanescens]
MVGNPTNLLSIDWSNVTTTRDGVRTPASLSKDLNSDLSSTIRSARSHTPITHHNLESVDIVAQAQADVASLNRGLRNVTFPHLIKASRTRKVEKEFIISQQRSESPVAVLLHLDLIARRAHQMQLQVINRSPARDTIS